MTPPPLRYRWIPNPIGAFALCEAASGAVTTRWVWSGDRASWAAGGVETDDLRPDVAADLGRYFAGEPVAFGLAGPEDPPFFARCWRACRSIPRGQTRTYGDLAKLAGGDGRAARAAGQSMRRNPLPVIVPCHRVVSSTGALHAYAGQQDAASEPLRVKQALLALEGARSGLGCW